MHENIELCYCCGLPVERGQRVIVLRDDDGLEFVAHAECAERDMEIVSDEHPQSPSRT